MNRLLCRIFGHQWSSLWKPGPLSSASEAVVCVRCKEAGYLL